MVFLFTTTIALLLTIGMVFQFTISRTKLKGSTLTTECGGEVLGRYKIREERYRDIPKNEL